MILTDSQHGREAPSLMARTGRSLRLLLTRATSLEQIAALRPDYERLQQVTGNTLPFALHEWHMTWCERLMNSDSRIEEEPLFLVLRDDQRQCVAILPFILARRRIGPFRVTSASFVGADPALTEIRTPLIEPEFERVAIRAARDALAQQAHWDWVQWTGLEPACQSALSESGESLRWQEGIQDFVLDLPDEWETFRRGLKRNIRESLRHCYNSLKRDGHHFKLEVIDSGAALQQGLERFLSLHKMRADLTERVPHPDRFESSVSREFLRAVCERLAARGALRLFGLRIGNQIVAMRMGFLVSDSLYLYYSGFDPAWWRCGVMTTTVAEAIKYAIAQRLKTVNLSPGRDIPKLRWSPRPVDYASAFELQSGIRSRVMNEAYLHARGEQSSARLLRRIVTRRRWI